MKNLNKQQGVTLLELMIGIAIGLMVVATALGALMISRGLAGTTNEATMLQQQAALISRTISRQLRQAGGLQLDIAYSSTDKASPSIFDNVAIITSNISGSSAQAPVSQTSNNGSISLGTNLLAYTERVFSPGTTTLVNEAQFADCLGWSPNTDSLLTSTFSTTITNATTGMRTLFCAGKGGTPQPIASNLLDFSLSYVYQSNATTSTPQYQILTASQIAAMPASNNRERWSDVIGVNVCMILVGSERIDTAGATYVGCDGSTALPMNNKLIQVYRNTFQIRTQGAPV